MDVEREQNCTGKKSVRQYIDLLKSQDPGVQSRARRQQPAVPTPRGPTRRRRRADEIDEETKEEAPARPPPRQRTITGMFQQQQARTDQQIQQEVQQQLQERGSVDV